MDTAQIDITEILQFISKWNDDETIITTSDMENIHPKLVSAIEVWNIAYRKGSPIVDDSIFDAVIEICETYGDKIIDTHDELENSSRKSLLPIIASSMNKCKTVQELIKWAELKGFDFASIKFIITPKFDGLTLVVREDTSPIKVWTKGRSGMGLDSSEHYKLINHGGNFIGEEKTVYSRGEAIIKKSIFVKKYSIDILGKKDGYENPRNMVSSIFRKDDIVDMLKDVDYIRFHLDDNTSDKLTKKEQIDILNTVNAVKIPYTMFWGSEITEDILHHLFTDWASGDHEIDGLILEINDAELRNRLGFETSSNNPCFARAFKGNWEDYSDTEVIAIKRQISKQGYLKPVIVIKPVRLNGVTVDNVFVDNERWMSSYGIGVGTKLTVKRSGMVIPRVSAVEGVKVVDAKEFNKLIKKVGMKANNNADSYHSSKKMREALGVAITNYREPFVEETGGEYTWNASGVELMLVEHNDDVMIQKNIAFFEIIGADGISDGIITELYNKGFKTIPQILELAKNPTVMIGWEGWGERSVEIFAASIKKAIQEVKYTKLMHATGFFGKLGSKKLDLVQHFDGKPTFQQLVDVDGFSDISANEYIDGYDKFQDFIKEIGYSPEEPIGYFKQKQNTVMKTENRLSGKKICITGTLSNPRKHFESLIAENGGEFVSSVSKTTNYLILGEDAGSKADKAAKLGVTILSEQDFMDMVK